MRFELQHGADVHAVEVRDLGAGRYDVRWARRDGKGGEAASRAMALEVREVGEGSYSVLDGHEVHDVRVERSDGRRVVELADGAVVLEYLDPLRPRAGKGGHAGGPRPIASPIPGRVVRVPVNVGDEVQEGQAVVIVEAMKMANELRTPIAGRVAAVRVAAGATVEAGQPLVVVEPLA